MRIIILSMIVSGWALFANAQHQYVNVKHLHGREQAGNNNVEIQVYGDAPGNTTFGNISPYHIGNKKRINGYDFNFEKPVKKVRINISAINDGEKIEIGVNGFKYFLEPNQISSYVNEHGVGTLPVIKDGIISYTGKNAMASATIDITPGNSITSVYVHHLNGLAAGAAFDLSFEDNALVTDETLSNENNDGLTGLNDGKETQKLGLFPNPNAGSFTLKGDMPTNKETVLEIVNTAGQKVFEQRIQPFQGSINESLKLDKSIANGVYVLYLNDGEHVQSLRFTLNR